MYQMKFYRNTETHTHKQTKTNKAKIKKGTLGKA